MNQTYTRTPFIALVALFVASSAAAQPQEYYRVVGTVRDTAGDPVERAEVVAGLHRVADPRVPGGCEDRTGRLLAVARTATNAAGIYDAPVPIPREGEAANCVIVWATLRPGVEPWGERAIASALWRAVPLAGPGAVIDLVLRPLPPLRAPAGRRDPQLRRRPDDDWADAARERVPGFAGFMLEGCNVVVFLTERGREDVATEYVRETFRDMRSDHESCSTPRPIIFRRAAYDYAQLRRWYAEAGFVLGLEGVSTAGISTQVNRIRIAVLDSVAERRVRRALASTQVPREAVVIEVAFAGVRPERPPFGPATTKLGLRLAAQYNALAPVWSADSREIVFQTLDGGPGVTDYSVRAVDVASREVRALGSVVGIASGRNASHVTADGHVFFALSDTSLGRVRGSGMDVIYRVPLTGGAPERVLDNLGSPSFALSANGQRIAHVSRLTPAEVREAPGVTWSSRREVLAVTELATRRQLTVAAHGRGNGGILGLSPDGRYLAQLRNQFTARDSAGVWLHSVDDSSSRRIISFPPLTPVPSLMVGGLRWVGDTPHVLLIETTATRDRLALTVVDGVRGTRRDIGTVPAGERLPWEAAWSRDGHRVALWVPIATGPQACSPAGDCISRRVVHFRLYLFDTETGSVRMLAEMASTEASRWLEFSPDGQWLGYSLYGDIRVHRL